MQLTEFDISIWQVFHIDFQIIGADTALIFHIK